ncbi:hypothetical protein [Fictibacillus sp. NRS-1165]|uniref:hypothetical protein n=1 Tax=Fictibacillus sp. NRS-1165 TaxID=3144463 RepID=UPI003D1976C7
MKKRGKFGILVFTLTLLFSMLFSPTASYAKDTYTKKDVENATLKTMKLGNDFIKYVKTNKANIDEKTIQKFFKASSKNKLTGKEVKILNDADKKDTADKKAKKYTQEKIADSKILAELTYNGRQITILKNGTFAVEEPDTTMSTMASGTKWGTAKRSYYSWVGLKLFTVSVTSKFRYTGSKAYYHSGYDAYNKRGSLSLWQVTGWKEWKERSGTSYNAYASGNFHVGFEVYGIGLILQEFYIKHTVQCTKKGTIKRYYKKS